jgi:hypothetical protein
MPTRVVLAVLFPFAKLQYNFGSGASKHTHHHHFSLLYPLSNVAALKYNTTTPTPLFFFFFFFFFQPIQSINLDNNISQGTWGPLTLSHTLPCPQSSHMSKPFLQLTFLSFAVRLFFFFTPFIQAGLKRTFRFSVF